MLFKILCLHLGLLLHMCEAGLLAHCSCGYRDRGTHIIKCLSFGNLAYLHESISASPPHGFKILPAKAWFYPRWKALHLLLVSYPLKQVQNTFLEDDLFYRPSGNKPQLQGVDPETNFSRKLRKTRLRLLTIKSAEKSGSNIRCESDVINSFQTLDLSLPSYLVKHHINTS